MKNISSGALICFLTFFVHGCTARIEKSDIAGFWKSDDGATLALHADGRYEARGLNLHSILDDENFKNKKVSLAGSWQIGETGNQKRKTVELSTNLTFKDFHVNGAYIDKNGIQQSYKIHCTFLISGNGIFESKKPYVLSIQNGDPDDMNRYEFKKAERD